MATRRNFMKTSASLGILSGHFLACAPESTEQAGYQIDEDLYQHPTHHIIEPGLKITAVETFTRGPVSVVRVQTDDGSEGWGQLSTYDADIAATILHRKIAPHVLGQDPAEIDTIGDRCIEANYKFPWSFVCRALTGVDTAIWDLFGKIKQQSVCELLGGQSRSLLAYGSSMRRDITSKQEAERLLKLRDEKGFQAFKIRVGKVNGHDQDQWPGRTEELVPTVRQALGGNITLLADGNSGYTPRKAIEVGKLLQDHEFFFFEEPCPYWELEWTAEVAAHLTMNVAGGEQDNDLAQWRRMIHLNAVDIVQPDICYVGGFTRALRVAEMARQRNKHCIPHSANLSGVTIFTLHLLAAISNADPFFEYSIEENDYINSWIKQLYFPALTVENGRVTVPPGPGWGITFNPDWLVKAERQISQLE